MNGRQLSGTQLIQTNVRKVSERCLQIMPCLKRLVYALCFNSCRSEYDNKADVSAIDLIGRLIAAQEGQFFSTSLDILRPLLPERVRS